MVVVEAELITVDKAKQVRQESLQELKQLLKGAGERVGEVVMLEASEIDKKNLKKLTEIQSQIESLARDVENTKDEDLDTGHLDVRMKEILALFERIDSDVRFRTSLILAETNVVLAYSSIRWIADAEVIIDDPDMAEHQDPDWTFYNDKLRLAKELQERFPWFYGYRIKVIGKNQGISVQLKGNPPSAAGVSPLEALKQKVEEFLAWELRKVGLDMTYELIIYDESKLIEVEINQAPR